MRGFADATLKENLSELGLIVYSRALQGTAPPIGTLFGILFIYFLHQIVQLHRLLDLNEIFRAHLHIGVDGVFARGHFRIHWHLAIDTRDLEATCSTNCSFPLPCSLSFYEPLKERVLALSYQWFYRPGHQLDLTLREIEHRVTKAITMDELTSVLLDPLQGSGRVPLVSLYLWDHENRVSLVSTTGQIRTSVDAHHRSTPVHGRVQSVWTRIERIGSPTTCSASTSGHEDAMARLRTMDAMGAQPHSPHPFRRLNSGMDQSQFCGLVDTFSQEEVRRLIALADKVAIVLENIYSFEEAENQARLAAMGTMAAGLAHEIRNPLAGIKGAAQYLQSSSKEADEAEIQDFLDVIVDEADRLNIVVTQFSRLRPTLRNPSHPCGRFSPRKRRD